MYYSELKNNDVLKFAGKLFFDLEKTILSEVTQSKKDKYNMQSLRNDC